MELTPVEHGLRRNFSSIVQKPLDLFTCQFCMKPSWSRRLLSPSIPFPSFSSICASKDEKKSPNTYHYSSYAGRRREAVFFVDLIIVMYTSLIPCLLLNLLALSFAAPPLLPPATLSQLLINLKTNSSNSSLPPLPLIQLPPR